MAFSTINKSSLYQSQILWTGNGSTQSVTGVGFTPDLAWIKCRSDNDWHDVNDTVRGATKSIYPNTYDNEDVVANALTAFGSDGYSFGNNGQVNGNTKTYVSWNWKAGGAGSSNTDGSINTTSTSANTTAGFSISTYTGTGANATVGHGLGAVPKMIITKVITSDEDWMVYHEWLGNNTGLRLNGTNAQLNGNIAYYNNTTPTSSVFTVGTHPTTNWSGKTIVAYCFAEVPGYSKFEYYYGNGSTDGPFTYTGFRPSFIMIKRHVGTADWYMFDDKISPSNVVKSYQNANKAEADHVSSSYYIDVLSNGFKIRGSGTELNEDGAPYIYMAFGQPIVSNSGIMNTAV